MTTFYFKDSYKMFVKLPMTYIQCSWKIASVPASEFLLGLPTDPAHVAISSANLNSNNYLLLALLQA